MTSRRPSWWVPAALVVLGTVPVVAGPLRLVELSGGAEAMPSDARYAASPLPVVIHIVSATVFAILGAFQVLLLDPSSPTGVAPKGGAGAGGRRAGGGALGALAEPVLPAGGGHA